jgi:hypothetical protein
MKEWQYGCHLDFCDLDDGGVNAMSNWLKSTTIATEAGLFSRLALGATMAIDTLGIIALQTKSAGSHASDSSQNVKLLLGQLAVMVMVAVIFVRAFSEQEVVVAQLQLFQTIQIVTGNALEVKPINTLPVFIALNSLGSR